MLHKNLTHMDSIFIEIFNAKVLFAIHPRVYPARHLDTFYSKSLLKTVWLYLPKKIKL